MYHAFLADSVSTTGFFDSSDKFEVKLSVGFKFILCEHALAD